MENDHHDACGEEWLLMTGQSLSERKGEMLTANLFPAVSIVICTYSRAPLLRKTLMSLEKVMDIDQAEVIVVDNNCTDHTADIVLDCMDKLKGQVNIRYMYEPRQGLSVARNSGMGQARAPIVAFLDDDALPSIEWLASIRNAFCRYPDAAAIGGVIRPIFEVGRPEWLVKELELPFTIVDLGQRERLYPHHLYPFGANMAIRRDVLLKLRFPESLGRIGTSLLSGEEEWLFGQLRKNGKKLYYIPGMKVSHFIPKDRLQIQWIKRRYYYQGISAAVGRKHLWSKIQIVSSIGLKFIYITVHSALTRTPGTKLLNACRMESIRGSLNTLRHKDAAPSHE